MSELFSTVSVLHESLDYHAKRHNLLSSNVANADTPGFRPAELVRVPEDNVVNNLPLARTAEAHQRPFDGEVNPEWLAIEDATSPIGADGNAVEIDREMSKISANNLRYEGAARLVRSQLGILAYVAADGMGR